MVYLKNHFFCSWLTHCLTVLLMQFSGVFQWPYGEFCFAWQTALNVVLFLRLPVLLPFPGWQPDCDQLWRHHLVSWGNCTSPWLHCSLCCVLNVIVSAVGGNVIVCVCVNCLSRAWWKLKKYSSSIECVCVYVCVNCLSRVWWKLKFVSPCVVPCGILRQASRPPRLRVTPVTWWASPWPLTPGYSSRVLVTPQPSCGMYGRACAGRPSPAMSLTSMPSAWVKPFPPSLSSVVFFPLVSYFLFYSVFWSLVPFSPCLPYQVFCCAACLFLLIQLYLSAQRCRDKWLPQQV